MKKNIIFLCMTALILCLSACSNINVDPQSQTPNIDTIKAKGKIVMLTNAQFPPFEYIGEGGRVCGIDADIAQEIANDMGVALEMVNFDFDFLIDSIKSGKGDFVASGMTVTNEREQQVLFSEKYVTSAQYAVVRKDSDIDIDNLGDLVFSVQEGTKGDFYATDELHAATLLYKSSTDASQAVISGKCDIALLDDLVAKNIVSNIKDTLKVIDKPLTSESYAIAVAKGKEDLLEQINFTLKRLISEGKIDEISEKYMHMK